MRTISTDLQEAKRQLQEILSRPEFRRKSIDGNVLDPENSWDLSPSSFDLPPEWIWGIYIFLGVFLLACLLFGIYMWWNRFRFKEKDATKTDHPSAMHWLNEAKAYAGQGNYRLATRALFHYLLSFLAERRKIHLDPAKTNGDYRKEVEANWPIQAPAFSSVVAQFDETWYGEKTLPPEGYVRYQQQVDELVKKGEADETK
ncbi:DUF4129 domain-containing protein [Thermoflavimicrobium dichotomicum]|uniref:Protein-glutamine gamma-glutamyltransferase-like C-terminal domain-containing protein n=1 Tax=Thermoflavimicrobium dichotomicum TaxID=46223 RepID=A0A1I3RXJ6_9BACL|nr:DUF4129 domain-containing protein [Thermoflavimicrobium dichotomicum]SFJ49986.1 protein of unknown function [Thermoflavimicrobium dichotomicum]